MSNDWDSQWDQSKIPYGQPVVPPRGNEEFKPLKPKEVKAQLKAEKIYVKQVKKQKRANFRAAVSSKFALVVLGIVVAAVIIYNVLNGIQMVGPDFDQIIDRSAILK